MKITALSLALLVSSPSFATLNVVATTTTMRELVREVCGTRCKVESIVRGPQDPHFVEAKPSYMVKLRDADLLVAAGLDLEVGWLPNVVRGSRNPSIQPGRPGYFDAGSAIQAIEIPVGQIDRAEGDVHPLGNPHFQLDPLRFAQAAEALGARLGVLDSAGRESYARAAAAFASRIRARHEDWARRVRAAGVPGVITYHRTLNYFLDRYSLKLVRSIEPKPGIPPTAKHIIDLMDTMKSTGTSCVLVESFFETDAVERLRKSVPVRDRVVPTEIEAMPEATSYEALIESLVGAVEYCGGAKSGGR
jgi:zinc/manganese transport system substrate-binding protein